MLLSLLLLSFLLLSVLLLTLLRLTLLGLFGGVLLSRLSPERVGFGFLLLI